MTSGYLKLGSFYWKKGSRTLFIKNSDSVNEYCDATVLTQKQYDLLSCLITAYPATLTKEQIIEVVWKTKHISSESLPQLIIRTRQVLQDSKKEILINDPGIGYRLNFEREPETALATPLNQPACATVEQNTIDMAEEKTVQTNLFEGSIKREKPWLLFLVLMLTGVTLFQVIRLSEAIHFKAAYESHADFAPYPYIIEKNNRTIVTIDNHECIYLKSQQLLRCQ